MRRSFRIGCPTSAVLVSPETALGKAQVSQWIVRLLELSIPLDSNFFSCLQWCTDDLKDLTTMLQGQIEDYPGRTHSHVRLRQSTVKLQNFPEKRLADALEEFADDNVWFQPQFKQCLQSFIANRPTKKVSHKSCLRSLQKIQKFFGLSNDAMKLCSLAFLMGNFRPVENYFEDTLSLQSFEARRMLSYMLDIHIVTCKNSLSQLADMGILDVTDTRIRLCDSIDAIWKKCDVTTLQKVFCQPLHGKSLPIYEFNISDDDKKHTLRLLRRKGNRPVHILLYGAPGTGKTSFAHTLASELQMKAWGVPCKEDDSSQDRRTALTACLHMAASHKNSFVLVDEAERLLDTAVSIDRSSSTKAWLNAFLERPNQRVIWISNDVYQIDHAVRRRFSFSIHFGELSKIDRRRIWSRTMERLNVEGRITPEAIEGFVDQYPAQVAVIEHALREAKAIAPSNGFAACVERILRAHATLDNDGESPKSSHKSNSTYNLDGVCTAQPFEAQLEQIHNLDKHLRSNKNNCPGMGTILFYGPPGTGKTALAKHLAHLLGRELSMQRASDLLDPYVGVTEKNIAAAFARAQHDGDILVIDEADSFLNNRDNVRQGWEKTQINEFLTALESYTGICICTTNRRDGMDPAAMRRFSFKIPFGYAGPTQLDALYSSLLAPLAGTPLPAELKVRLDAQKKLTPGDFHAVRMQFWLNELGSVSHDTLLAALLHEQAIKLDTVAQRIGFA